MTKSRFTVVVEHGDRPNPWTASIKELPECHTFGRGLAQTRARLREALELWIGSKAKSAEILEELPLPEEAAAVMEKLRELHEHIEQLMRERERIVAALRAADWSVRDLAGIFDLSHQRIGQIATAKRKKARRKAPASR